MEGGEEQKLPLQLSEELALPPQLEGQWSWLSPLPPAALGLWSYLYPPQRSSVPLLIGEACAPDSPRAHIPVGTYAPE